MGDSANPGVDSVVGHARPWHASAPPRMHFVGDNYLQSADMDDEDEEGDEPKVEA